MATRGRSRGSRVAMLASLAVVLADLPGLASDDHSRAAAPSASAEEPSLSAPTRTGSVVLLHGLGRSAANMSILKWRLRRRGYDVCNIGYDTRVESIEDAVASVHAGILECAVSEERPLHFVTHSLGGLVLRALFKEFELPKTGRAVMLAPPNSGSEIADWIRSVGWIEALMGPLATQLGTRDEDLPQQLPNPPIPFGVIAGDQWINPMGRVLLPAPHDGTVSVASTRLPGMSDHLVLSANHTFIMNSARVAVQIDAFLEQGRFLRSGSGG